MQTKLTLRIDEDLIERAKRFADRDGRSVSQIVADYFALLDADLDEEDEVTTPIVASFRGALSSVDIDSMPSRRRRSGRQR